MLTEKPAIRCNYYRAIVVLTLALISAMAFCQRVGDLLVTPTRLKLDDKARSGSITLVNRGTQTVRYRLNLVDLEMSENGDLRRMTTPFAASAAPTLSISPREVVLAPGGSQRIKLLATMPFGMPDGELRTHLAFEPLTKNNAATSKDPDDGTSLKIRFETKTVISIPIIVNHGKVAATATLSDANLTNDSGSWVAKFKLGRIGNRTIRGEMTVSFVSAKSGKKTLLGIISALPVYCPNSTRSVRIPLIAGNLPPEQGQIEFNFVEIDRGKSGASARLLIPKPE